MMNEVNRSHPDEDLLTPGERALLLADQFPAPKEVVAQKEPATPTRQAVPKGTFGSGRYTPPSLGRFDYIQAVQAEQASKDFRGYQPLPSEKVRFLDRVDTLNLFHPDFVRVLQLFLTRHGEGTLTITKAMTPPTLTKPNPHTIGMAVDIRVANEEERARVMNAAWLVGIPTIVSAGGGKGEGHVHLDICPYEPFLYDGDLYEGPWSL